MPENQKQEYNPLINGFSGLQGPLNISLNEAKQLFGQLPSTYGFVSANKNRSEDKALNLKAGYFLRDLLSNKKNNLKKNVYNFFKGWHRDLRTEFQINIDPFFNLNTPGAVHSILKENSDLISYYSDLDIKAFLSQSGSIRKDILNSIAPDNLIQKSEQILTKKIKQGRGKGLEKTKDVLKALHCYATIHQIKQFSHDGISLPEGDSLYGFADEISSGLLKLHSHHSLKGIQTVSALTKKGIEFEYATRDYSYLELGKKTGDCTADKRNFQSDSNIENIFWTVFSWILDRNYQIIKVFFDGDFAMKVHLLPLFITRSNRVWDSQASAPLNSEYVILAIDAIETTVSFRDDKAPSAKPHLIQNKQEIFSKTIEFIEKLADSMNIHHIYAEKFSNTPWVRDILGSYPEIFFHVDHLGKIDQLEDVFCLAEEISSQMGYESPEEVFMELQMKNTYLSPGYINKAPGIKSFALVRGNATDGIPMKRIIGV